MVGLVSVFLLYTVLATVFLILGRMGRDSALKHNSTFGIRTRTTLDSPEAWYRVHRSFAPWSFWAAGVSLATALLFVAAPGSALRGSLLLLLTGLIAAVVVAGSWAAHRSLRQSGGAGGPPGGAFPER